MSTTLKHLFEQVYNLSRAEQLLLISSIAQLVSEEESGKLPDDAIVQSVKPFITKGDKSIDPTGLFGIWASNPRNLQEIRRRGWA